ncbi:MAG: endonuclease/exonuclease/phosphatase family protein [Lacunisphaera sp.]|nr:endonuclease/exonuclease/phosphatase family protein [Lacunisphaera sp.]
MNHSLVLLLLLLSAPWVPAAEPLRVMSFNVRYAAAPDGENAWPQRTEHFFATIAAFAPDLIGFQEVLAVQHDALTARLPDYGFSGVARIDGQRQGEWACLAYRKARFTAVDSGNFWLSATPEVAGSKSWDAGQTRICSWVRLRETATGKEFFLANTHLDDKGNVARQEASRLLAARLPQLAANLPALLTGDFNLTEDNPAYAILVQPATPGAIRWIDSFREAHPDRGPEEATGHGFKGRTKGSRIDFIFHTDHFLATESAIDRTTREGRYPSDHYPVTAVLQWK